MTLDQLETSEVPCNLCGTHDSLPLHVNCSLNIVRCRACGLVFVNPQPTLEALREYHAAGELMSQDGWSSYFNHSQEQICELWKERFADVRRSKQASNVSLLDVGAGYGDFLHYASKEGWQVSGFEFSPAVAKISREKYGISLAVGDLFEMPFAKQSFDVITMWHVLEHLANPMAALRRLFQLLRPGGVLVLEVPNLNCLVRKSYRVPMTVNLHLYHFSRETLSSLASAAGFKVLRTHAGNTGFLYPQRAKIYAKRAFYACARVLEMAVGTNVSDCIRLHATKAAN
jgi:2-polyprenyl-3-methyl-5-hydroxy-6-metoxy-1,4-benzoquinol methylase